MTWLYRSTSISFSTLTLPARDTCRRGPDGKMEMGSAQSRLGGELMLAMPPRPPPAARRSRLPFLSPHQASTTQQGTPDAAG